MIVRDARPTPVDKHDLDFTMTSRHTHIAVVIAVAGAHMLLLAACAQATPAPAPDSTAQPAVAAPVEAATSAPPASAPNQPTTPAEATSIATLAPAPTPLPAPTLTPIPQQHIVVHAPAAGAALTNPFQLSGSVALTPLDRKLAYVLKDVGGVMLASGMVDVQGEPGQPGVFSGSITYPPALPGFARLEVLAVDGSAAVEAQIPSVVVNPQKGITLNLNGVAASAGGQIAPRVPAARTWVDLNGLPEHMRVLFDGEAAAEAFTPRQRQLLVLPLAGYRILFKGAEAERFDETIQTLRDVLAARPQTFSRDLLLLPASDQSQALQAHVRYLTFNGGSGVRFVTYLTQEIEPINSSKLVYVFQGLTNDGQHLISAYVPVSSTVLAATPQDVSAEERDRYKRGYADYVAGTVGVLEQAPDSFKPALVALDGMIESLQIGSDLFEQEAAAPATGGTAILSGKATERVNVRSGPGTGFRRLQQLANGEEIELLQRSADGQWLQVQTANGVTGWVSSDYVTPSGSLNQLPISP